MRSLALCTVPFHDADVELVAQDRLDRRNRKLIATGGLPPLILAVSDNGIVVAVTGVEDMEHLLDPVGDFFVWNNISAVPSVAVGCDATGLAASPCFRLATFGKLHGNHVTV